MSRVFKKNQVVVNEGAPLEIKHTPIHSGTPEKGKPVFSGDVQSVLDKTQFHVDEIMEEAEKEAVEIRDRAKKQGYDEGYTEGFEKGAKDGYTDGTNRIKAMEDETRLIVEQTKQDRLEVLSQVEPEIVTLIGDITESLVADAAFNDPELIQLLIKKGLSDATILGDVIVFVSKEDYEEVERNKEEIVAEIEGLNEISVVKDASLKPMDCLIETTFGTIDCSLNEQMEGLKRYLKVIYENR